MAERRSGALVEAAATVLAAGVPLAIYVATLAPTVYGLDSAELTSGAYTLGIVHAPGSPTYMLLGHLFTRLPIGDVGYRLNLLSAVAAALAALLLYRVIRRLTGAPGLALAATWFAAFSYYFWVSAVAAELYALHAAFVAGLLLLALRWREGGAPRTLCALAFFFGLGAGNHLSMLLLAPGFAWLAATGRRSPFRPGWLPAAAMLAGLAGLSVYLYLPLRYLADAPLNYARDYWRVDLASREGFLWMVSARMFDAFLFGVPLRALPAELLAYARQLWSNFVGLGALLGVVGLAAGLRRERTLHIGLALLFAGHLAFYLCYRVADKAVMLLPTFLIWSIWIAVGAQLVPGAMTRIGHARWSIPAPALLAFLAAGCLAINFQRVDLSDDWSARQRGEEILRGMPAGAVFLGTWSDVPILEYLQIVEAQRSDVRSVNLFFTPGAGGRIAVRSLREGRAVYTSAPSLVSSDALEMEEAPSCGCFKVRLTADGTPP